MISKRDSKPFLVKFDVAVDENQNIVYETSWNTVFGLISDPSGQVQKNEYGSEFNFDKTIIVNATSVTRRIKKNTLVLIDNMPTTTFAKGDYSVKYIYPEYNNEIVIGLEKIQGINIPKLYFIYDDQIVYYQLNFDKDYLVGYINKNETVAFSVGDYLWTKKPSRTDDTSNRIRLTQTTTAGHSDYYLNFTALTFVEDTDG